MLMSLEGLRVLSLESRRAKDIESLIVRQAGIAFVAPSVRERAVEDHSIAFRFVEQLEAGQRRRDPLIAAERGGGNRHSSSSMNIASP